MRISHSFSRLSKLRRGRAGKADSALLLQVEHVSNRPGEVGFKIRYRFHEMQNRRLR